jgi:hypothetical protein
LIETTDWIIDLEIVVGRKAEAILKDYHAKAAIGLPRILRLKENAPELDYSSFYVTTGTGTPAALLRRI